MTTSRGGRPHTYTGFTCTVEGCNQPRKRMRHKGRPDWYSKYCPDHFREDMRERSRARRAGEATNSKLRALRVGTVTQPVSVIFDAWEHDRWLGIVRYGKKRVFALKPVGNGYRATVTGMESVLLEADTPLSVWGKE